MRIPEFRQNKLDGWRALQTLYAGHVQIAEGHGAASNAAHEAAGRLLREPLADYLRTLRPGVAAHRSLRMRVPHDFRARPELLLHLDPAIPDVIASVVPRAATARSLMTADEAGDADVDVVEDAVARYGPADAIGRWGPVQTFGGRTVGEPCTELLDACGDYDLDAWLTEAKSWTGYAKKLRDDNVAHQFGANVQDWPNTARHGEIAYKRARELIGGDLGYLDGDKIHTLQSAQRYAKVALELYTRAIEADIGKTWDVGDFAKDTITDASDTPSITPPPPPSIPLKVWLGLGAGAAATVMIGLKLSSQRWWKKPEPLVEDAEVSGPVEAAS